MSDDQGSVQQTPDPQAQKPPPPEWEPLVPGEAIGADGSMYMRYDGDNPFDDLGGSTGTWSPGSSQPVPYDDYLRLIPLGGFRVDPIAANPKSG